MEKFKEITQKTWVVSMRITWPFG